jgi:hypothetical protein
MIKGPLEVIPSKDYFLPLKTLSDGNKTELSDYIPHLINWITPSHSYGAALTLDLQKEQSPSDDH